MWQAITVRFWNLVVLYVHPVTDIVSEVHQMADAAGDNGTSLELGSFVHPVTDIVSEVQQLRQAITVRPWNLVVLYIQSLILCQKFN